ncbi:hypothetical protein [Paenibacillus antarcticus]|uniref:Preprotein translocase subunit Tim44 n=1 Tax=Paenibacillus antarcticus TaxID=253703 RepID=A0A168PGA1_9BACL|nr:hypothetical protein [Paenibacillus antarcticus]OAB46733.1 hypothetical protein PBAT_08630 [Paenibacillus antarcticus]
MKKWLMVVMMFTLIFATVAPATSVDAKRGGGGFKSGTKSFTNTPKKSTTNSNVSKTTTNNKTNAAGTPAKRGFFSGGGLMKGLMIGGLAGMLFGGMFGGMGMLGNILGLMINVLAVVVLISLAMAGYRAYKNRRKPDQRDGRY